MYRQSTAGDGNYYSTLQRTIRCILTGKRFIRIVAWLLRFLTTAATGLLLTPCCWQRWPWCALSARCAVLEQPPLKATLLGWTNPLMWSTTFDTHTVVRTAGQRMIRLQLLLLSMGGVHEANPLRDTASKLIQNRSEGVSHHDTKLSKRPQVQFVHTLVDNFLCDYPVGK